MNSSDTVAKLILAPPLHNCSHVIITLVKQICTAKKIKSFGTYQHEYNLLALKLVASINLQDA